MFRDPPRRLGADGLPARDSVGDLLLRTLPGRALVVGAAIRLLASLAQLVIGRTPLTDAVGTVGTLALLAGIGIFAARLIGLARRRLLWRVRRKLILSFIFVGLVPALLIIVFFALCGMLLFSSISSYVVETRLRGLAEQAQFIAQTTAIELSRSPGRLDLADRLERKQATLETRFPEASLALVPVSRTCASDAPAATPAPVLTQPVATGPWPHLAAPTSVPAWVACGGFSGLMAYWAGPPDATTEVASESVEPAPADDGPRGDTTPGNVRLFVRAVAFPSGPAPRFAVVLDLPLNELTILRLRQETGISLRGVSLMKGTGALPMPGREAATAPAPVADGSGTSALQPTWVAFFEFTDWVTGRTGTATVSIMLNVAEIYARLSPSRFGQLLVLVIFVVGVLLLIVQFVALLMGLALARSITGSVHELFVGTERVRQGDFSHRIAVLAKDQLGELADSFNSMTAHLSSLLAEMAEKKRLEEELRIARRIQMSLLPQNPPMEFPGVSLTAVCQPAREVGGDYYDFLPLEGNRLGLLIADVAGKGTSAALYMAELKGLMLSLTQIHRSPRDLLVAANRIISAHLDSRSFITMTYAVLDLEARTMTWARAGHTPLIHLPGARAGDRAAHILVPDGMVLGLRIDNGERFAAALEEVTIPLAGGDLFMFFTDGLSEQMNQAEDLFGEPRLGAIIEQHGGLPCDELRERILREVHAFADGAPQHDDMTFILLRVEDAPTLAPDSASDHEAVLVMTSDWPIIFRSHSDIEASVVAGLLEAHGIPVVRSLEGTPSVFPVSMEGLRQVRISVPPDEAAEATRLIETHRADPEGAVVIPIRHEFEPLERRLGYRFRDRGLLEHALTHKSRAQEDASGGVADNESLEFLGDAVLGLVVAEMLFREFPHFHEGQKSKVKATLVSTTSLAVMAEHLGLGEHLLLGRGEEKTGGRRKQALLADTCEALIAAIFLDGGLEEARRFILTELSDEIARVRSPEFLRDFKSTLQERLQGTDRPLPDYVITRATGPDHDKLFHVEVRVAGETLADATGRTKKEAEQEAARLALVRLAQQ